MSKTYNCAANLVSLPEAIEIVELTRSSRTACNGASADVLVAASGIAAVFRVFDAGNSVAADLVHGVDARSKARLSMVGSSSAGEIHVLVADKAHSGAGGVLALEKKIEQRF